jgi:hypothetical protein
MFKTIVMLGALLAASTQAIAADPVTDAMQKAYGPYRVALFKTNSNSPAEARQALDQARKGWSDIATRYAATPPIPYNLDSTFADSLSEVSKVYDKANDQIGKGQLTEAHETLEHARDIMAALRQRNGVIVYSDHMNAYHTQMEHVLIDGPKTLEGPNGLQELTAQTGALEFLAIRLKSEAPTEYTKNEEFNAMFTAVQKSVADLKSALFTGDIAKVKDALTKVKVPYSKMFIKFG